MTNLDNLARDGDLEKEMTATVYARESAGPGPARGQVLGKAGRYGL